MYALMRKLLQLTPELKGRFYLSAFYKVLETFFIGAPYGFLLLLLYALLSGTLTLRLTGMYTLGMAVCFCLQGFFGYLFVRTAYPIGTELCERLRLRVGDRLREFSMEYFSKKTTGDTNALVTDELNLLTLIPRMAFPQFVTAVALPVAVAPFLFSVDWRLALVALAVVPISIPILSLCRARLDAGVRKRNASLVNISSRVIEYVQGMEVVRSFRRTGKRFAQFESALRGFRQDNLALVLRTAPLMMAFHAVLDAGFVLILLYGAYLFLGGETSLFALLTFLILGVRLYEPVKGLGAVYEVMQAAGVTIERLEQLLQTPTLAEPQGDAPPRDASITFDNVTFSYGGSTPVLRNVSFTIPEKTITAFVGPSGAGKTTITRLIARFWDVESGRISIGGSDIRDMRTATLLSRLSMVFQDVYLFADTIANNIGYGRENIDRDRIIEAAKAARCHEFISALPLGYDTVVGEAGCTLSGGERQRISIARAILKDAPIVLLDEATASLDPENEFLIQEALNVLVRSKTLLIIAHRLSTITSANQIIVLDGKGGIDACGTHAELLAAGGIYTCLWESRLKAGGWQVRTP